MKKILTTFLISLSCLFSFAQIKQGARREFDVYNSSSDIILTGNKGFMMVYRDTVIKNEETWKIRQFDTELKDVETIAFKSDRKLKGSVESFNDDQDIYYKLDYALSKNSPFKLFIFDAGGSEVITKEGILPPKFVPSAMHSVGHSVFISGVVKRNAVLLCLDTKTGNCKLISLPGIGMNLGIEQVEPNETNKTIAVTIIYGKKPETRVLQVCIFKENGDPLRKPIDIKNTDGKYPVSASVTWLEDDNFMVAGAYSVNKRWTACGIYISSFTGNAQNYIKYYDFADLKNFNKYLPERQQEKMEKKIEKKKSKGKDDIIETFVKTHKIIKYNDQYILIGEIYYPTYTTTSYITYTNGQAVTRYQHVFDGFQYTHATVISVDKDGNKKWDNCFSIWPGFKPFHAIEMIRAISTTDNLKLVFSSGTNITAEEIKDDGISENSSDMLATTDENDKVKYSSNTTSYWYDNYFLTYGFQKIKNTDMDKKKRSVYYVSKIQF